MLAMDLWPCQARLIRLKPIEIDEFISNMIKPYASFLMYENHHVTKLAFDE